MDRETQSITIGQHEFTVKSYATAREANAIQQALFKGTKVEMDGEKPRVGEFNTGALFEQQRELITQMVVALDRDTSNVLERCLELRSSVWDNLTEQLDGIIKKKES